MGKRASGIPTLLIIILVLTGFGALLYVNSSPVTPLSVVIPTQAEPTSDVNAWQAILSEGFGENSTPLPTIAIPTKAFVAPTLPSSQLATDAPLFAIDVVQNANSQVADVATPTIPAPTATMSAMVLQLLLNMSPVRHRNGNLLH